MGRALVLLATLVVGTCALAGPAWGVGDPSIDRLIVKNPVPGWDPLAPSSLQALVATESRTESAASNEKVTAAAEGWQGTTATQRLIVAIDRFAQPVPGVARNVRTGAISLCVSATGNAPTSVVAFPQISGSEQASCSGRNSVGNPISCTAIVWVRGNLFVLILGAGLPTAKVESIAESQDSAVPPAGVYASSSASASNTGSVIAFLVVALVVVGLVIGLVVRAQRRRRRTALAPPRWSPPEGGARWAADPSGQHELRYWSGTAWTEHVLSNGIPAIDRLPSPTPPAAALVSFPASAHPAAAYPVAPNPVAPNPVAPNPVAPDAGAPEPGAPDPAPPVAADPVAADTRVSGMGTVSDDGHWFWNGTTWVSTTSNDGRMRWTGTQWVEKAGPSEPFS